MSKYLLGALLGTFVAAVLTQVPGREKDLPSWAQAVLYVGTGLMVFVLIVALAG